MNKRQKISLRVAIISFILLITTYCYSVFIQPQVDSVYLDLIGLMIFPLMIISLFAIPIAATFYHGYAGAICSFIIGICLAILASRSEAQSFVYIIVFAVIPLAIYGFLALIITLIYRIIKRKTHQSDIPNKNDTIIPPQV